MTQEKSNFDLKTLFTVALKWRKFLLISITIICVLSVAYALIAPKTYTSTAVIIPPGDTNILSSFLPFEMTRGLGGTLAGAGGSGGEANKIMSILKSRRLAEETIREFDLMKEYEKNTIEDALEAFNSFITIQVDEESTIRVKYNVETGYFHFDDDEEYARNRSAEITQYIVDKLDEIYTNLSTQKARYERQVVEKRYEQNKNDIKRLEEEFKAFSERTGVIALPEQLMALVQTSAELEAQLILERIKLDIARNSFSSNSSEIESKELRVKELQQNLNRLVNNQKLDSTISALPSYKEAPELALEYARIQRNLEVQGIIYEFLTQQYEQLKLQEAKDTPSIQFVDLPKVPTKRSSPTRSLLVIALVMAGTLLILLYIYLIEFQYQNFKRLIKEVDTN